MTKQPSIIPPAAAEESYELKAFIIKAMAHPSRLKIIDALAVEERCVCELREIVGSDMSTVSKHLSVLKAAGIVQDRKAGLQVYYRLRVPCIVKFFECVERVMETRFAPASCTPCASTPAGEARP